MSSDKDPPGVLAQPRGYRNGMPEPVPYHYRGTGYDVLRADLGPDGRSRKGCGAGTRRVPHLHDGGKGTETESVVVTWPAQATVGQPTPQGAHQTRNEPAPQDQAGEAPYAPRRAGRQDTASCADGSPDTKARKAKEPGGSSAIQDASRPGSSMPRPRCERCRYLIGSRGHDFCCGPAEPVPAGVSGGWIKCPPGTCGLQSMPSWAPCTTCPHRATGWRVA